MSDIFTESGLRALVENEGLDATEVASHYDCGTDVVWKWMREWDVGCDYECDICGNPFTSQKGLSNHSEKKHGVSLSEHTFECAHCGEERTTKRDIEYCSIRCANLDREGERPWHDVDLLKELYVDRDKSIVEIASRMGTGSGIIWKWLDREGVDTERDPPSGPDHYLWNEETTSYGVGWNDEKKELVRERDGRECQMCGMSQKEHLEEYGDRNPVHHIQPAKTFDDPHERNAESNLITLCRGCHRTVESMAPLVPQRIEQTADS